jgi:hypothetical protein
MIDPAVNPHKDGDYYDTCPRDGCLEVDALHRSEGNLAGAREAVHDWSIYNATVRDGGCGFTWTRTTSSGAAKDRARGREPRWRTRGAVGFVSVPSEEFRSKYEAIFGHP